MKRKFLRRGTKFNKKFGKTRKKQRKWRRPRGRHNKMREKRKGRPKKVEIGYRMNRSERGKIKGKIPMLIRNLKQAEKIERGQLIIIAKMGKRKKGEVERKIKERGGEIK